MKQTQSAAEIGQQSQNDLLREHAGASAVNDNGETVTEDSVSLSTFEPAKATLYLLEQWLANNKNLVEAVADTRLTVGYDPHFTTTELQILQ